MHARRSKLAFAFGLCLIGLVLLIHMGTIGRQAPWEDEIFAVSTGLSIARSQPPILSVLAQYPRTGSPVAFYGPVSFEAEAFLIRVIGLSVAAWRLLCFAGVILTVLVSSRLVRLAGGDKWAQLITALILTLAGSIADSQPGRWDFVTSGLFLGGLLLLLDGVEAGGRGLLGKVTLAGVCIGFALASTPRSLTVCVAAMVTVLIVVLCFRKFRRNLLLGSFGMFLVALLIQSLLMLPWGLNSFSWYAYVKRAARQDAINATPITGQGNWEIDFHLHKSFLLLLLFLLLIGLLGVITHCRSHSDDEKLWLRIFLGSFAVVNLLLMLLLLRHALGQSVFWLPPMVIALLCWFDWKLFSSAKLGMAVAGLTLACLFILSFQEAQQITLISLAWNRMSTANLTAFVRHTVPKGAVVYGPVGGYFYPVELAGDTYLYPYEHTTPGLYSEPNASISEKLEEEICIHPTYVIWPTSRQLDPMLVLRMPKDLENRLQPEVGEFRQPPLSGWRETVLRSIGPIGFKYGYADVAVYPLKSLNNCGKK